MVIQDLHLDIETRSSVNINKSGVYPYASASDFDILLLGCSVNGGEVQVYDLANGEEIPKEIIDALLDDKVIKWAFNANFERVCLSIYLAKRGYLLDPFHDNHPLTTECARYLNPASWRCTMVWSAYLGLPLSLAGVGSVLGLEEQKMSEGKTLIRRFCTPAFQEPTGEKWETFKAYNRRDVEVEMAIHERLSKFPVPDFVWEEYVIDQEINDRGVRFDMDFVERAIQMDAKSHDQLMERMKELTGLANPNSVAQLKGWFKQQGIETESLDKKSVESLLKDSDGKAREVLELRQQLAKSSVKKYQAMEHAVCEDGRARGMHQFYGASRTGRFAGRLVQLQNLARNQLAEIDSARKLVCQGDYELLSMLYDSILFVLSQLVRTALIPADFRKFIVADFSAIEARVLSWLAKELWRMKVFEEGGDIYCATASRMFHCNVVKHGENGHLRQKGKQAELACIAEGQLVLTDEGLIPIEQVTISQRVWDGEEWVHHDGVIFKGEREVITYEGLTATPDHHVWVEGQQRPIPFGLAAASGAHLIQTGNGGQTIRMGSGYQRGKTVECCTESLLCADAMHRMRSCPMAASGQSSERQVKRLPELLPAEKDSSMAGQAADRSKATLRESARQGVPELWSKGNTVRVSQCAGCRTVSDKDLWAASAFHGTGQDRYEWALCAGKSPIREQGGKPSKSETDGSIGVSSEVLALLPKRGHKEALAGVEPYPDHPRCRASGYGKAEKLAVDKRTARLYDIRNAGKHHRFTVSGKLVHNCGYGGSVGALKAFGALESGMKEEELKPLVDAWRTANPHIVEFWWAVDRAAKKCIQGATATQTHGIKFICQSGMMFIELPSGRRLAYAQPRIIPNKFGGESIAYMSVNSTKKWALTESYGPKLVENITQAISRDLLCYSMRTLRCMDIVAHVHDELIIECDPATSVEAVCEQMARTPDWAKGLLLRADGYECKFYKKD